MRKIEKVDSKPVLFGIFLVDRCPYCGQGFDAVVTDCDHPTKLRPIEPDSKPAHEGRRPPA